MVSARLDIGHRTLLSADIAGSTSLYETLGDLPAQAMVAGALAEVRGICASQRGRVFAEIGDQVLAFFDDAGKAAAAASDMHVAMAGRADAPRIRLRVGLHHGPLARNADLLSGETARIVQWVGANAKPEQTLATRAVVDLLPRVFRAVSRYVDDETWEFGSLSHLELYEIVWDVEGATAFTGEQPAREQYRCSFVEFAHGPHTARVDADHPVISIGRDPRNDLVVARDLVSRQHLRAQFSRGRCTVTDNSTNGSLVRFDCGTEHELKRESLRLYGTGVIVPGRPLADTVADFAIRFRCV